LSLGACGGGSDASGNGNAAGTVSGAVGAPDSVYAAGGNNIVAVSVGTGPSSASSAFNTPYTSVVVCVSSGGPCVTVDHVLIDTGSVGLRLMASALDGLPLMQQSDPNVSGNVIAECLPFADGYTWGAVANAAIRIGGESASAVPIQIIDDNASFSPKVPTSCTSNGTSLDSVASFNANGVLGVGLFSQDCGRYCTLSTGNYDWYYSCTASRCVATTEALDAQVVNPVALFATDNNGVILQLPSVAAAGATSASGYLVFGIGTQSNNGLGGATVLGVNASTGEFTTVYAGRTLSASFIDSGSNGLFFVDSSIPNCSGSVGSSFYCPSSTLDLSATQQGSNGTTSQVSFQIANLSQFSGSDFARDDVGGSGSSIAGLGTDYFDWGLPFFYGRTIYVAIEGLEAGGSTGPYFAF